MIEFGHFSGVNLLQGKPVYMTSQYHSQMMASNAVDGLKPSNAYDCASTKSQANPLLSVNMKISQQIGHVCVTNRLDGCCRKYSISNASLLWVPCMHVPPTARTVFVRLLVGENDILNCAYEKGVSDLRLGEGFLLIQ